MCKYCDDSPVAILALDVFTNKVKCSILLSACDSVGAFNPIVGIPMGVFGGVSVSNWITAYIEEMEHQSGDSAESKYPGSCPRYKKCVALNEADENFSEFWRVGKRMLNNNWVVKMLK